MGKYHGQSKEDGRTAMSGRRAEGEVKIRSLTETFSLLSFLM